MSLSLNYYFFQYIKNLLDPRKENTFHLQVEQERMSSQSNKPQTWHATLIKILPRGLVRITTIPLNHSSSNQQSNRCCPPDRVPRRWVARFPVL